MLTLTFVLTYFLYCLFTEMLGAQYLLLFLVYSRAGLAIEEDNLRNALNSIENRQRQLAPNYYQLPNKDSDRPLQLDDDNLMFLDSSPSDYGKYKIYLKSVKKKISIKLISIVESKTICECKEATSWFLTICGSFVYPGTPWNMKHILKQ